MLHGLDVSHFQGANDWPALKAKHGLSFAAAKCTEGTTFTDSFYARNRAGIRAAGMKVIAYHFARPEASSAATQARRFVGVAGDVDALCLDLEASKLSQAQTNAWMRAFGDALRQLSKVPTIAYLGGYAANGSGQGAVGSYDHWWYPRYTGITSWPAAFPAHLLAANTTGFAPPRCPSIWQFTDRLGGMDANVSALTLAELFGDTPTPTPSEGAPEMFVLQKNGDPAVWISDGITRRHLPNSMAFSALVNAHAVSSSPVPCTSDQMLTDVGGPIAVDPLNVDAIATAVVEALPPASTGGISKDDVKAALVDVFTHGTGGTP